MAVTARRAVGTGYTIRVEPYFRLMGEATMFIDDDLTLEQAIRGAKRAEEIAGAAFIFDPDGNYVEWRDA